MMEIQVSPVAGLPGQPDDTASVSGDAVTYNGQAFDLGEIEDGDVATPEGDHPFAGSITRENGVLKFGLRMAYDTATAEPNQPTDPAHWLVEIESGEIPDLVIRKPEPEPEPEPEELVEEETQDDL